MMTKDEATALHEAQRIVRSLATMLGWENVPPREVLERSLSALKAGRKHLPSNWENEEIQNQLQDGLSCYDEGETRPADYLRARGRAALPSPPLTSSWASSVSLT